jgi:hypothetical protein
MSLESDGGMILTGENRRTRRETCPSATLPTTNPTWNDLGANPGLRGERPATNDHGTAESMDLLIFSRYRQTRRLNLAYSDVSAGKPASPDFIATCQALYPSVVRNTDLPALQLTNILRIILKCIVGKEG